MKTAEEINALKAEVETLNKNLADLTEEELSQVTGGALSQKKKRDPLQWNKRIVIGAAFFYAFRRRRCQQS